MTPPLAHPNRQLTEEDAATAVFFRVSTLRKRSDFLKAARAPRVATPGFVIQGRKRQQDEAQGVRVGYTCSKKVGNAVARNRAKRRLREVARLLLPQVGRDGFDYVLIGRRDVTATLPFALLQRDLAKAVEQLHRKIK